MTTETTARPLSEMTPAELAEERQRLSYEASIATPGASKQLEAVEKQLGAIGRDAERAELAAAEGKRRAALEATERARVRREQLEAALEGALAKRPALCAKAELAMTGLLAILVELDQVSREAYRHTSDLGAPRNKLLIADRLSAWMAFRLADHIAGVQRPPRELRQALAQLLGIPPS